MPAAPAPVTAPADAAASAPAGTRDAARGPARHGHRGRHTHRHGHRAPRRLRGAGPGRRGTPATCARGPARRLLRRAADITVTTALLTALPWGLDRLAGPPLPGHWPGWRQVREFAASPLSDGTIIRALAGAAWLLWAIFTAALIVEIIAAVRGQPAPRLPAIAPLQALAATVAGAAVLTTLHVARAAPHAVQPRPAATAITGPLRPGNPARPEAAAPAARAVREQGLPPARPRTYRVADGDDLWDIAARYLGSGQDWPQVFRLNEGKPQPDGRALTNPSVILPGWILLLPQPPGPGAAPHPVPARPGSPSTTPDGTARPPAPSPQATRLAPRPGQAGPATPPAHAARPPRTAVRLPSGALAGIAMAVMVAAALALAGIQRRRRYRPRPALAGGLQPEEPPLPEVISALRRAAQPGNPDGGPDQDIPPARQDPGPDDARPAADGPGTRPAGPGTVPVGVRGDGSEAAAGIAALGGLGLTGPGAEPAARAVLASLLAQAPPGPSGQPAVIIVPAGDAARLLPGAGTTAVPGLSVPATLDTALHEMETLLLTQARAADSRADAGPGSGPAGPGITLIATCPPAATRRLAGILESGRRLGAAAVLLGNWPAGTTCQVAADGAVTAVTPPHPDLEQIRLFTLSPADAAAITGVLRDAGTLPGGGVLAGPAPAQVPPAAAAADSLPEGGEPPPDPAGRPVQLSLLGPLRITAAGQEISGGLRKARELHAFLAVYPAGVSGETISEALWPDADPGRAANQRNLALRKARDMLRAATSLTAPIWIINDAGRYRLDPTLISTDLQAFTDALEHARHAAPEARLAACRTAVALYRGLLADGTGYDWAEPYAETARRRALDAWTAIAEILQPHHPDQALTALETALGHDPYNEYLYVRIMRLQAAVGRPEAVRRTLALLESRLTDLGLTPSPQTRQAAASLLHAPGPPARGVGSADQ